MLILSACNLLPEPEWTRKPPQLVRTSGCTGCHNVDQGKPVPLNMIAMKTIFPGDNPVVRAQRQPSLNAVQDTAGNPFGDKMAVVNASIRGGIRGIARPLLLDLARKPVFLHDNSVPSPSNLLDAKSRGDCSARLLFFGRKRSRIDEYLRSLDTISH
jgi:hypothetical protein